MNLIVYRSIRTAFVVLKTKVVVVSKNNNGVTLSNNEMTSTIAGKCRAGRWNVPQRVRKITGKPTEQFTQKTGNEGC